MFCYKCGTQQSDGSAFCAACGAAQLSVQQSVTPPVQTYSPPGNPGDYQEPIYGSQEHNSRAYEHQNAYGQTVPLYGQTHQQQGQPYQQQEQTGYQTAQMYGQQTYSPYQPHYAYPQSSAEQDIPAKKKSGRWWKIAVPAVLVAAAAAAVYYFFILASPSDPVNRALANVGEEMAQRIDGSPLKALGMLTEVLADGTLSVSFDYTDRAVSLSGDVSLSYVVTENEYAAAGDISIMHGYSELEQNIVFEAFLNPERIAFGSQLIDNNYYGIKFSSFEEDIRAFAGAAGIAYFLVEQITQGLSIIDEAMNGDSPNYLDIDTQRYESLFSDFYKRCDQTSERVNIDSGGQSIAVTKTEIVVTKAAIIGLLNDLLDAIENDENIRNYFSSLLTSTVDSGPVLPGIGYGDMMNQLKMLVSAFSIYYADSSIITLTLFIGDGDRIMLMELDADVTFMTERVQFSASFDFGASVSDRWVFKVEAGGLTASIEWDYTENGASRENIITFSFDDVKLALKSDWSTDSGDFTLAYSLDNGSWVQTGELSGVFLLDSNGFRLSLDIPIGYYSSEKLALDIKGEFGADIKQIDFINVDQWDIEVLYKLESLFNFGYGGASTSSYSFP